jgi:glycosyltransferase involved in cell wall biosynthesis
VRILHVSDCYLPRLGGIEVQVHALARRQLAAGHHVEVATATPRARHDEAGRDLVDGVTVHRLTADLPFELPVHPRTGRVVAALLDEAAAHGGFDVAHLHTGVVSPFAYRALPVLTRRGVPVVVTVHSMWGRWAQLVGALGAATGAATGLDQAIGRGRSQRAGAGVVLSAVSGVAARAVSAGLGGADVAVLTNGIDLAEWQLDDGPDDSWDDGGARSASVKLSVKPIRGDYPRSASHSHSHSHPPSSSSVLRVVAVMRLAPRKRGLPLLRAVAAAREQVPAGQGLHLTVVGDGPQRTAMTAWIERHDADWVELRGRLSAEQIRQAYRRADVFVQASRLESFGIAALEARTAGLPVVAMAGTGVGEFVEDGVGGLLVADDEALAAALARLAVDVPLRRAMAAHNRTVPPPTTWPDVLRQCDELYARAGAVSAG